MTRQQWLWLFIWIFIFFLIFCVWNKTKLFTQQQLKDPLTNIVEKKVTYKKDMSIKIIKDANNKLSISGIVANQSIHDEIVDSYSKLFSEVDHKDLTIQDDIKDDTNISEIIANFAEDFSHFDSGVITYDTNKIEIDASTDNSVAKGSIAEKLNFIKTKGIEVASNLILNQQKELDINITKLIEENNETQTDTDKTVDINKTDANETVDLNETNNTVNIVHSLKNSKDIQKEIDSVMQNRRVQFLFAKDILTSGSKEIVDKIVDILKKDRNIKLLIIGHTDSNGKKSTNLKLSQKRAKAVKEYIVRRGISKDRLETIGYGESKPLVKNTTAQNRQLNRRVEFKVIGDEK